jgi:hypothetical protein
VDVDKCLILLVAAGLFHSAAVTDDGQVHKRTLCVCVCVCVCVCMYIYIWAGVRMGKGF